MLRFNRFGIQFTVVKLSLIAMGISFLASTTVGCNTSDPPTPAVANIAQPAPAIPFVRKKPDFGGEACLTMVLQSKGLPIDQDWVFDHAGVDPTLGRGCVTRELTQVAQATGLEIGQVWYDANTEACLLYTSPSPRD